MEWVAAVKNHQVSHQAHQECEKAEKATSHRDGDDIPHHPLARHHRHRAKWHVGGDGDSHQPVRRMGFDDDLRGAQRLDDRVGQSGHSSSRWADCPGASEVGRLGVAT